MARLRVVVTRKTNNKCACPYMDGVFVRWVAATCLSNRSFAATCKKPRHRRLSQPRGGIRYATCSTGSGHIPLKFRPQPSDFTSVFFIFFFFYPFSSSSSSLSLSLSLSESLFTATLISAARFPSVS